MEQFPVKKLFGDDGEIEKINLNLQIASNKKANSPINNQQLVKVLLCSKIIS